MKPIPNNMQIHLDGETTTICNCWVIERRDGLSLGFTDHDQSVDLEGIACEPSSGFEASQMETSADLAPDNHEVVGALLSDRLTEADIEARKYDGARIRHYVVNWENPAERALMQTSFFGEITREDGVFRAEVKSLIAQLDETRARRFEKTCNADLGDADCGVELDPGHRHPAIIQRVISDEILEVSGVDYLQGGWLSGGRAVFRQGTADEEAVEITLHVKNELGRDILTLWTTPQKSLVEGDGVVLYPGCDKLLSTCRSKFANAANFRGFPFMPGPDFASSYAANSGNMDGGPIVP